METPRSDHDLLRDFVESRNERAFRHLAERHSGLIYHTALRVWNDKSLAEDVSQRVLGVLAAKAAKVLRDDIPLSAWLHRTTILEAKAVHRSEARHHRKKEALMQEDDPSATARDDSRWQDALPHLDAAIDSLPEADRRVLLLHFVDGMTFPQVADRLRKSTVAVQKQSQRALAKLQQILGRRGVALSIGLIATGLTTEMAKAAPLALVATLGAKPLLAKTTSQVLVVKKTTVAAIAATALLCGVPLARQQAAIQRLESQLTRPELAVNEPGSRHRGQSSAAALSQLRRLAKDLQGQNKDIVRYLAAENHILGLTDEQLVGLMLECTTAELSPFEQHAVFKFTYDTLAGRDFEAALTVLLERIPKSFLEKAKTIYHDLFINCLRNWALKDSGSALVWFDSHLDAIRSIPGGTNAITGQLEDGMRLGLSQAFIFTDPSTAAEILRPVPPQVLASELEQLARSNSKAWNENKRSVIWIARELLPEIQATRIIAGAASSHIEMDSKGMPVFTAYEKFLDEQELSAAEIAAVIAWAGANPMTSALSDPRKFEDTVRHYRKWLEGREVPDPDWQVGAALAAMRNICSSDLESICKLLADRDETGFNDQTLVGFLEKIDQPKRDLVRLRKLADQADHPERIHEMIDQLTTPTRR
jgi:RNA polymerase sigma factor (sigma-70 family)